MPYYAVQNLQTIIWHRSGNFFWHVVYIVYCRYSRVRVRTSISVDPMYIIGKCNTFCTYMCMQTSWTTALMRTPVYFVWAPGGNYYYKLRRTEKLLRCVGVVRPYLALWSDGTTAP